MSVLDHQRLLAEAESTFPVNDWVIGGVRVWPYVRAVVSFRLAEVESGFRRPGRRHWGDTLRRIGLRVASAVDSLTGPLIDPQGRAPMLRKADVFAFTSSAARQAELSGRHVDTLCEPIYEELRKSGRSCHAWEFSLVEPYRLPRASRSYLVQRKLHENFARSLWPSKPPPSTDLAGYDAWEEFLRARGGWFPEVSRPRLLRRFREILGAAGLFGEALEQIRPRLVLTSNFGRYEMALHLACRRRSILSVEIQHGLQGALNGRYAGWTRVPPEGYDLLPGRYWCWDPESADAINAWSSACRPRHRALAAGNPWLEYCRTLDPGTLDARQASCLQPEGGRRRALLTLPYPSEIQPNGTLLPDFLLEAMAELRSDWTWWVRYHPLMPRDYAGLERLLRQRGISSQVRAATELPLFVVLHRTDLHLSHSSSAVLDANLFGVRSVLWSPYGRDYFQGAIAEGTCAFAADSASMVGEIRRMAALGKCKPRYLQPALAETLGALLGESATR